MRRRKGRSGLMEGCEEEEESLRTWAESRSGAEGGTLVCVWMALEEEDDEGSWRNGADWEKKVLSCFCRYLLDPAAFQRWDFGGFLLFLDICHPSVSRCRSGCWEELAQPGMGTLHPG